MAAIILYFSDVFKGFWGIPSYFKPIYDTPTQLNFGKFHLQWILKANVKFMENVLSSLVKIYESVQIKRITSVKRLRNKALTNSSQMLLKQ
jgi:hypothetical protein